MGDAGWSSNYLNGMRARVESEQSILRAESQGDIGRVEPLCDPPWPRYHQRADDLLKRREGLERAQREQWREVSAARAAGFWQLVEAQRRYMVPLGESEFGGSKDDPREPVRLGSAAGYTSPHFYTQDELDQRKTLSDVACVAPSLPEQSAAFARMRAGETEFGEDFPALVWAVFPDSERARRIALRHGRFIRKTGIEVTGTRFQVAA